MTELCGFIQNFSHSTRRCKIPPTSSKDGDGSHCLDRFSRENEQERISHCCCLEALSQWLEHEYIYISAVASKVPDMN